MAMTSRNRPTWHASLRLFMMMFALGTPCAPSALTQMDGNQGLFIVFLCTLIQDERSAVDISPPPLFSNLHFSGMAISVFVSIVTLLSPHQTLPFPVGSI